jgi:hypothetical protein
MFFSEAGENNWILKLQNKMPDDIYDNIYIYIYTIDVLVYSYVLRSVVGILRSIL